MSLDLTTIDIKAIDAEIEAALAGSNKAIVPQTKYGQGVDQRTENVQRVNLVVEVIDGSGSMGEFIKVVPACVRESITALKKSLTYDLNHGANPIFQLCYFNESLFVAQEYVLLDEVVINDGDYLPSGGTNANSAILNVLAGIDSKVSEFEENGQEPEISLCIFSDGETHDKELAGETAKAISSFREKYGSRINFAYVGFGSDAVSHALSIGLKNIPGDSKTEVIVAGEISGDAGAKKFRQIMNLLSTAVSNSISGNITI